MLLCNNDTCRLLRNVGSSLHCKHVIRGIRIIKVDLESVFQYYTCIIAAGMAIKF